MHKSNPKKAGDSGRKRNGFNLAEFQGWQKNSAAFTWWSMTEAEGLRNHHLPGALLRVGWCHPCRAAEATRADDQPGLPAPTFAVWTGMTPPVSIPIGCSKHQTRCRFGAG